MWLPPAVVPAVCDAAAVADQEAMVSADTEGEDQCCKEACGVFGSALAAVLTVLQCRGGSRRAWV